MVGDQLLGDELLRQFAPVHGQQVLLAQLQVRWHLAEVLQQADVEEGGLEALPVGAGPEGQTGGVAHGDPMDHLGLTQQVESAAVGGAGMAVYSVGGAEPIISRTK